jgi:hypothetical protein
LRLTTKKIIFQQLLPRCTNSDERSDVNLSLRIVAKVRAAVEAVMGTEMINNWKQS